MTVIFPARPRAGPKIAAPGPARKVGVISIIKMAALERTLLNPRLNLSSSIAR